MPTLAPATTTVADLLALFHGDEHTRFYYSPTLVQAVCDQLQPSTDQELREVFYPGMPPDEITRRAGRALERGYLRWKAAQL